MDVISLVLCILVSSPVLAQVDGTVKWGYNTGGAVYSSPAIGVDGTIYAGSCDYNLHAINPDGTLKWKYATGNIVVTSPAIGLDGTIHVGSFDSYLYAISPDGTLKWRYQTADLIETSPVIGTDGTIYVGSFDGSFYAINPDGTLKWIFSPGNGRPFSWPSPAIGADGTIYVPSYDGNLYALNPDGTLKWSYLAYLAWFPSPAIGADGTIYAGAIHHFIQAINPDGTPKWRFPTGNSMQGSPAIGADGTIYIGSDDGNLYAMNPDGTLKWKYQTGYAIEASPVIGADGTIFVGSWDGYFYALNPDGTLKWKTAFGSGDVLSSPAIGPDGTIYVQGDINYIYALNSSSGGLANTPWPKFHHDLQGTGRAGLSNIACFTTDSSGNLLADCAGQLVVESGSTNGRFAIVANRKGIEVATNPGQFYYNLIYINTTGASQVVAVDFVRAGVKPVGAQAIHAMTFPGQFSSITPDKLQLVNDAIPGGSDDRIESVTVPAGGTVWVSYHLEYVGVGLPVPAGCATNCPKANQAFSVEGTLRLGEDTGTVAGTCSTGALGYKK